jgi:hypothetical protein
MVDKLNRTAPVASANISRSKVSTRASTSQAPVMSRTLIHEIISELASEKSTITGEAVQHKIIVKTLMANFGFAATTEPKFKKMYNHINTNMKQNPQAQSLIAQAIKRYVKA